MTPRRPGRSAAIPKEVDRAASPVAQGEPYAALDLGTNSCRMLVARAEGRQLRIVDSFSKGVQLGAGLESSGLLSRISVRRTIQALRVCRRKLEQHGVRRMRLVATTMLSDAVDALVEDDEIMGESLLQRLELEGAEVVWLKQATRALGAIRTARAPLDAAICDIRLPDGDGADLYRRLCQTATPPPFLFITAHGGVDQAVRLMRSGAADYVTKPFDMGALLERLATLMARRTPQPNAPIVGVSPAARRVEAQIAQVARQDGPVLIRGGRGSGKERVARRIHDLSERRAAPFVRHCPAASANAQSRLRSSARDGGDGVLYIAALDMLAEEEQAWLIAMLDNGLPARLVAACTPGIDRHVPTGSLRHDLYYRLARTEIAIPPLRERGEDAVWLATRLFDALNASRPVPLHGISALAEEALHSHDWPGEGREVRSRLVRAMQTAEVWVQPVDLFPERAADGHFRTLAEARAAAEKAQIVTALDRSRGQVGVAARLLGISRTTLWEKMQKLGLS